MLICLVELLEAFIETATLIPSGRNNFISMWKIFPMNYMIYFSLCKDNLVNFLTMIHELFVIIYMFHHPLI